MVPFTLAGLGAFVAAGLVMLLFRDWLSANGHSDWLWICVAGFLTGLIGLATMIRHDAHRRRRRALTHPEVREIPEVDET
jgi:bacteriorhodopsin